MVFSFCLGGVVEEETRGKNRALSITQHLCPLLEACASAPGTVFLNCFFVMLHTLISEQNKQKTQHATFKPHIRRGKE